MALLAFATVVLLLLIGPSPGRITVVLLLGTAAVAVLVVVAAAAAAERVTRRVHDRLDDIRSASAQGRSSLHQIVGRLRSGESSEPRPAPAVVAVDSDPFTLLAYERAWEQHAAETAVLDVADLRPGHSAGQQVEVFVNVARRMQSLVHREITLLDELESQVEDPDLLKGLFTIDHLATRMRRQSESLAVLGGAASRRQWTRPVSLYEVLRSAVAEVEHYSRVKVVPPVSGTLSGSAVVDVIHLIAELIENATKFSPPHSLVMLRAEEVPAGLAVDVEDRGLGMAREDLNRMNEVLVNPGEVDVAELLRDGRIGLFVIATLARKHGVRVQLQKNLYGGTQAVVLLPNELIPSQSRGHEVASRTGTLPAEPVLVADPAASSPAPRQEGVPLRAGPESDWPKPPAPRSPAPSGDQGPVRPSPSSAPKRQAPRGERPALPERKAQTHLAPELRDAPTTPERRAQDADHTPGLMATFQSGFHRAEKEDDNGPSGPGDSTG